jgi:diguanylate cyclase (GGDEF)-like protein
MIKARIFSIFLFIISIGIVIFSGGLILDPTIFLIALALYWIFSTLYHHLRVLHKKGNITIDYGISYSLSFGIIAGPFGLFIFETMYRFTVYFSKKWTKTEDPDEFFHTLYNIGAFVIFNSVAYYLFHYLYSSFQSFPFGFSLLMIIMVIVISLLSDVFLVVIFSLLGDIKTLKGAINFFKNRNVLDMGKTAFTNGLLLLFLQEEKWEMLISLFILNYLVSLSIISKAQNLENKLERDKFEQMAYTDFLTGVSNRAFMDLKMAEFNKTEELIGIVVADIDKFKRINDNYNHAVGDQVIQHFAHSLSEYLDDDDYLFRSGGEEFTMIIRNKTYNQSVELVKNMLVGIEKSEVNVAFNMKEEIITYTASFGLYYFKVNETLTLEKGYNYADNLLLQSKQQGRNRVSIESGIY